MAQTSMSLPAFLGLGGEQLFEGGDAMEAGELVVGNDLFGIGVSLVESHAEVFDGRSGMPAFTHPLAM